MGLGMEEIEQGLVLDLRRGFSNRFSLSIMNNGNRMLVYNIPLSVLQPDDNDKDDAVDLAKAFGEGLLEITDENQTTVRINYPTDSYYSDS